MPSSEHNYSPPPHTGARLDFLSLWPGESITLRSFNNPSYAQVRVSHPPGMNHLLHVRQVNYVSCPINLWNELRSLLSLNPAITDRMDALAKDRINPKGQP